MELVQDSLELARFPSVHPRTEAPNLNPPGDRSYYLRDDTCDSLAADGRSGLATTVGAALPVDPSSRPRAAAGGNRCRCVAGGVAPCVDLGYRPRAATGGTPCRCAVSGVTPCIDPGSRPRAAAVRAEGPCSIEGTRGPRRQRSHTLARSARARERHRGEWRGEDRRGWAARCGEERVQREDDGATRREDEGAALCLAGERRERRLRLKRMNLV